MELILKLPAHSIGFIDVPLFHNDNLQFVRIFAAMLIIV